MYAIRSYYEKNFEDAGLSDLIEIHHGDALKVISSIKDKLQSSEYFDFIFIDADKERYIQYFDNVRITSYNVCYTKLLREKF